MLTNYTLYSLHNTDTKVVYSTIHFLPMNSELQITLICSLHAIESAYRAYRVYLTQILFCCAFPNVKQVVYSFSDYLLTPDKYLCDEFNSKQIEYSTNSFN